MNEPRRVRRLRLTDDQRRRLAAKGKALGRRLLSRVATIVTPDTILRWHRRLIAAKWAYPSTRRVGRLGIMKEIRALLVRMATNNPSWGWCRIRGELKKLDHRVALSTIAKTLKEHGIWPAPDRPTSWRTFLRAHARVLVAADRFTAEVWTARGLVTHHVPFVLDHTTRAVATRLAVHAPLGPRCRDHDRPRLGLHGPARSEPDRRRRWLPSAQATPDPRP